MKNGHKVTLWERYLTKEIGIEFKACLYFFAALVFYCTYKICLGVYDASILHMAELIFLCYAMGYVQVYLMGNFDEADSLGVKEIFFLVICSGVYTVASYFGNWYDRNVFVTVGFFFWQGFTYVCAFLIYRARRKIDEKILNEDLKLFQTRNDVGGGGDVGGDVGGEAD